MKKHVLLWALATALAMPSPATAKPRRPQAKWGHWRQTQLINDPYEAPAAAFTSSTMLFNGSSQQLDLGAAVGNGWGSATIAYWFRLNSTSWGANLVHVARNAANQRQFTITQAARGGNGELTIGFSAGTTMINCSVPDLTFRGPYWHHLVVSKSGSTLTAYADGTAVALANCTGTVPASVGSSTAPVRVGATGASGSPASYYTGKLSDVAMWTGWAATAAEARALWGNGYGAVDYRTIGGTVPTPTWYVPGSDSPPTEVIGPLTVGGTAPTQYATTLPPIHFDYTTQVSARFMLQEGTEPDLFALDGTTSALYTASPSAVLLGDLTWLLCDSRGTGHIVAHHGYCARVASTEWAYTPLQDRAWPPATVGLGDTFGGDLENATVTDPTSSRRSMTLSKIAGIGVGGADRVFRVFNETDYPAPSQTTSAVSVTSNVAQATVSANSWVVGDWLYSTGHTQNAGDSTHPVQVTAVDGTHVSYPLVRANGALADGVGTLTKLNPVRRVWVTYTDDSGSTWHTPYDFVGGSLTGSSSEFTSVGRGRVVQRPDGSLLLPYYRLNWAEAAYDACLARSTDGGDSWAFYTTIWHSANRSSGAQAEEPYCQYVGAGLRCQVRVDQGQDPLLEGNVALNGVIFATISTNDGASFPTMTKAYDGRHHPIFLYRPSDGLMVAVHGSSASPFTPQLRVSRDQGQTWSDPQDYVSPFTDLNMQGDLLLTPANRILWLHAQETDNDVNTRVWADQLRESWLRSVTTP